MKKSISSSFLNEGLCMRQATLVATALLKLGVFGAGAYLSVLIIKWGQQTYQWESVGLIFGVVILVWQANSVNELIGLRGLGFLTASTLIWILVYSIGISGLPSRLGLDAFYQVLSPFGWIAMGTILLPIAHGWLLGARWRRVLIAIPCIFGVWWLGFWYLIHVVFASWRPPGPAAITYTIPIWQGTYLLCMFG